MDVKPSHRTHSESRDLDFKNLVCILALQTFLFSIKSIRYPLGGSHHLVALLHGSSLSRFHSRWNASPGVRALMVRNSWRSVISILEGLRLNRWLGGSFSFKYLHLIKSSSPMSPIPCGQFLHPNQASLAGDLHEARHSKSKVSLVEGLD